MNFQFDFFLILFCISVSMSFNFRVSVLISSTVGKEKGCVSVGGNDLAATHPVAIPARKRNIVLIIFMVFYMSNL